MEQPAPSQLICWTVPVRDGKPQGHFVAADGVQLVRLTGGRAVGRCGFGQAAAVPLLGVVQDDLLVQLVKTHDAWCLFWGNRG